MKKIPCPYTYPHKSREAKVNYICGSGGYYSRDGHFPIEFNVAAYRTDFSFDHIWKKYNKEFTAVTLSHDPEACTAYYRLARRLHAEHESSMWEWGQEDAARSLTDDDTYRCLWDGTELSVKLELHGRSGKHLVISEFDGTTFSGLSTEDLRVILMTQTRPDNYDHSEYTTLRKGNTWLWSAKEIDLLYRYVRQCEIDFTSDKASEEVEYQGAFQFFANIVEPAWEDEKKAMADHAAVVVAACEVRDAVNTLQDSGVHSLPRDAELDDAFALLCKTAGVSKEELNG